MSTGFFFPSTKDTVCDFYETHNLDVSIKRLKYEIKKEMNELNDSMGEREIEGKRNY